MKTPFASSPKLTNSIAQLLPLSPEDKQTLIKEKTIFTKSILLAAIGLSLYCGWLYSGETDLPPIIPVPAFLCLLVYWRFILNRLNGALSQGVKQVGSTRVVRKERTSGQHWLALDGPFQAMKHISITEAMYDSVQLNDQVYIEVVPGSKTMLSLRKLA